MGRSIFDGSLGNAAGRLGGGMEIFDVRAEVGVELSDGARPPSCGETGGQREPDSADATIVARAP